MSRGLLRAMAFTVVFGLAPVAWGATVTIEPSKDASIFANNVNNASGAGNGLFVGTNAQSSPRRSLVAFDVAGSVPAGATIQSVQLKLTLGSVAGGGGGAGGGPATATISLHQLLANWGEGVAQLSSPATDSQGGQGQGTAAGIGDVTWSSNFNGSSLWSTPGGTFKPAASASAAVGTTLNAQTAWTSTAALVSDVQSWLNNPSTNFGWLLQNADEAGASTFRAFYSRNVATAAFHPRLEITYATATPEPSGLVLALSGGLAGLAPIVRNRSRRGPLG
jgi:hypothetical protein